MSSIANRSQEELVTRLVDRLDLESKPVINALKAVDRADFCPESPYMDTPQQIGYNATISAPHMHAMALDYLADKLVDGARALDIGSGSGYLAVCMTKMVGPSGKVVGIEHIRELVDLSVTNTRKNHAGLLDTGNLKLIQGDGRVGYPSEAPYNAIHVGAAADQVPKALIDQLALGGRMVIPVGGPGGQQFVQYDKSLDGNVEKKELFGVIYVPLTSQEQQLGQY